MIPVSVIIITKNEAEIISDCITAARLITDDIVIIDNDSTDQTPAIATEQGCRVYQKSWDGYGANKNKGIELARYEWILSLDADELPDMELIRAMHNVELDDATVVYDIKFRSYFGKKMIRFGNWGRDHHVRLFNRSLVRWSEPSVHETLILPKQIKRDRLNGHLHHYSVKDMTECNSKAVHYAMLSAEKYFKAGKRANAVNLYISPIFSFIKSYILFLGFLDGKEGLNIAKMTYKNKWLKYHYLNSMENNSKKKQFVKANLVVEY